MKFLVVLWGILTIVSPAFAWNEPDSFLGLKFNQDIEQQLLRCPDSPASTFRSDAGKPCWKRFRDAYVIENSKIADIDIFLTAYQADKKLGAIRGSFRNASFATILGVFNEQYGKATTGSEPQWMSKGGVKLQNTIFEWKGDVVSVQLRKLASKIDESDFTLITTSFKDASRVKETEKIKDAAKGL